MFAILVPSPVAPARARTAAITLPIAFMPSSPAAAAVAISSVTMADKSSSLSEAGSVFDPGPVEHIIRELAARAVPLTKGREAKALRGLTAVDGSIFQALSRAAWALWQDEQHRGVKLHLHFSVFEGVPRCADAPR